MRLEPHLVKSAFIASVILFVGIGNSLLSEVSAETASTINKKEAKYEEVKKEIQDVRLNINSNGQINKDDLHPSANKSYMIDGVEYQPSKEVTAFSQTGNASWYGKQFHGRKTASGERFDMNELTAAHRTLPIPSYVKVTNLKNGKEIVVKINDRGPFHGKRVLDLSYGAAKELDFLHSGTAKVKIERVFPTEGNKQELLPEVPETIKPIFVVLDKFDNFAEANDYLKEVTKVSGTKVAKQIQITQEGKFYNVRLGPFEQEEKANRIKQTLLSSL